MEPFVLLDEYSRRMPDLISGQTKAIIHNKMCTYSRTNYLGSLIFTRDDDPTKEITLHQEDLYVLFRTDVIEDKIASDTVKAKVKSLFW